MPPKLGADASAVVVEQALAHATMAPLAWFESFSCKRLSSSALESSCSRPSSAKPAQPVGGFGNTVGVRLQGEHKL